MVQGPREKLLYVIGVHTDPEKADVLCTVDVDPDSPTYCQVRHVKAFLNGENEELVSTRGARTHGT